VSVIPVSTPYLPPPEKQAIKLMLLLPNPQDSTA